MAEKAGAREIEGQREREAHRLLQASCLLPEAALAQIYCK